MQKITTFAELKARLETAKVGGQFASVTICTDWKLNQYPTDGTEKVKRNLSPIKVTRYTFNFAESYKKAKAKAEGCSVDEVEIDNSLGWVHDVPNVLKHREASPNKHNIIVMPKQGKLIGYYNDGVKLTEAQIEYCKHYVSNAKKGEAPKYIAPYVSNITELVIDKVTYSVAISE